MTKTVALPKVVIVGRMNVGKSTLFNRLSEKVKSITLDYEGVTRDFISDTVHWQDRTFQLIDTGGISLHKTADPVSEEARKRVIALLDSADLILFVCDGTVGLLTEDREIAKLLHKVGKPVIVLLNKSDAKISQENMHEFDRIGHRPLIQISAAHGSGIEDLLEYMMTVLPSRYIEEEPEQLQPKVVILGKPNVGKSSLINLLLGQERALVADMPGTTREAITEKIRFYSEDIQVTDTPGIRRKRGVTEPLETLMVKSSFHALDQANMVLLMIDSSEGHIADQELKLAFYAFDSKYRALIILFNKNDLADERQKELLVDDLDNYEHMMKKIEQLTISCKDGKNIGRVLPLIKKVWARHCQEFSSSELTMLFQEGIRRRPIFKSEQELFVLQAKQVKTAPITIALKVNIPQWFEKNHLAYFEQLMRKKYDLKGVPIRFIVTR
jgi:GTP-binding protein